MEELLPEKKSEANLRYEVFQSDIEYFEEFLNEIPMTKRQRVRSQNHIDNLKKLFENEINHH